MLSIDASLYRLLINSANINEYIFIIQILS